MPMSPEDPRGERDNFLRDRLRPPPPVHRPRAQDPPTARLPAVPLPAPPRPPAAPRHLPAAHPPQRPETMAPRGPWADLEVATEPTPAAGPSRRGWRRILRVATLGLIDLGPSAAERRETQFEAAIQ